MSVIRIVHVEIWKRCTFGINKEHYGVTFYDANGDECEEVVDPFISKESFLEAFPTPEHVHDYARNETVFGRHIKMGAKIINHSLCFWEK